MNLIKQINYYEQGEIQSNYDDNTIAKKLKKYCPNKRSFLHNKGLHLRLNPHHNQMQIYPESHFFEMFNFLTFASPLICRFEIKNGYLKYEIRRNILAIILCILFIIILLPIIFLQAFGIIPVSPDEVKPSIWPCFLVTGFLVTIFYLDKAKVEEDAKYFKLAMEYATGKHIP